MNKNSREYYEKNRIEVPLTGKDNTIRTNTQHTPWTCQKQSAATIALLRINGRAHDEQDYEVFEGDEPVAIVRNKKVGDRIVRVVNSHDALIQAVKDLRYAFYIENSSKKLKDAFVKHGEVLKDIIAAEGAL